MSEICVASHHESIAALLADPEFRSLARKPGFLIELRLDHYSDLSPTTLEQAVKSFAPAVLVTYRHPAEGGKNPAASDEVRLGYLQQAALLGVKYVDIELRTNAPNFKSHGSRIIGSFHNFDSNARGPELSQLTSGAYREQFRRSDILKIATFDSEFVRTTLLEQPPSLPKEKILIAMGETGLWSRVLGAKFGSPLTYARGENAPGTAPGQLTWRDLDELYRYREIQPDWPFYAVIGNPIGHSLSPLLHNTALKALGLKGVYLPFKVDGDPVKFVRDFTPLGLQGLSITIPHKEADWKSIAHVDPIAEKIGAINTLARRNGEWFAKNSDAAAAADSLERAAGSLSGKTVLIMGAGGAARAAAFGIRERGANIVIVNRTAERARTLADALGARACAVSELKKIGKIDAIVNTTPLGMYPNVEGSPLEPEQIPAGSIVFDTVYNPLRTKLLNLASARGCKTVEGVSMFIGQGLRQFELWTGMQAPRDAVENAVLGALRKRQQR